MLAALFEIRSNLSLEDIQTQYSNTSNNIYETSTELLRPVVTKNLQHLTLHKLEKRYLKRDEVFEYLKRMSLVTKGNESMAKQKVKILSELVSGLLSFSEIKFFVRVISSSITTSIPRVKQTKFLRVLSEALEKSKLGSGLKQKEIFDIIQPFVKTKDVPELIQEIVCNGLIQKQSGNALNLPHIEVGVTALPPMLAKPIKEIDNKFVEELINSGEKKVICEYKYDGFRAIIHYNAKTDEIKFFSRSGKISSLMEEFPEQKEALLKSIFGMKNKKNFIIDAEYVICDKDTGNVLSFQDFQNRANIVVSAKPVLEAFDAIMIGDDLLIELPLEDRRKILTDLVSSVNNDILKVSEGKVIELMEPESATDEMRESFKSEFIEQVNEYMQQSLEENCEGLMIKGMSGTYELGKRSWIKLKKEYIKGGLYDTIDLIPIGAKKGIGKRTGRFGSYLMGTYDHKTGKVYSVCSIGTGLNDEKLEQLTNKSFEHYIPAPLINNHTDLEKFNIVVPKVLFKQIDCWLKPNMVWEIGGSDITTSKASSSGMGIRFPKFIRTREDKDLLSSTSRQQLEEMQQAQKSKKSKP